MKSSNFSMKKTITSIAIAIILIGNTVAVYAAKFQEVTAFIYEQTHTYNSSTSTSEGLAAVCKDGNWGFIDKSGKEVVPCIYTKVWDYSEGLAAVCKDNKVGFVNYIGSEVIPFVYDSVSRDGFSEGKVAVEKNGKWGYIDITGEEIIPFMYDVDHDMAGSFEEGKATVQIGSRYDKCKYGVIDQTGKEFIPVIYDELRGYGTNLITAKLDNKWGYLDRETGKVALPFIYGEAGDFSDGFAIVKLLDETNISLIDSAGRVIINTDSSKIDYHDGYLFIERLHSWIIDETGIIAEDNDDYLLLSNFHEGMARIRISGDKQGFIDTTGEIAIPAIYDRVYSFNNGLAEVCLDDKWGRIDKTGRVVVPIKYDYLNGYSDGLAAVRLDDKWGFVDTTGRLVVPIKYDRGPSDVWNNTETYYNEGPRFTNGLARVSVTSNGITKFGYIDTTGKEVVPLIYDAADRYAVDGLMAVRKGDTYEYDNNIGLIPGKWGFVSDGIILTPITAAANWAEADVDDAIKAGLVPQRLQSNYTQAITRSEFCALAVALYENVLNKVITERATFTDTNDEDVEKMAAIGVVLGTSQSEFSPNSQLTREQAATMLSRLANALAKPFDNKESTFSDNDIISDWAIVEVGQVQAAGIMQGTGNNRFSPEEPYTREQSIVTFMRMYNVME